MDDKHAKKLGKLLKARRQQLGLSALQLANDLEISHSTILRLEAGTFSEPSAEKLARIAEALGLSLGEVYTAAGYDVPNELPAPRAYFRMKLRDVPTRKADAIGREVEALLTRHGVNLTAGPAPGEDEIEEEAAPKKSKKKWGKK